MTGFQLFSQSAPVSLGGLAIAIIAAAAILTAVIVGIVREDAFEAFCVGGIVACLFAAGFAIPGLFEQKKLDKESDKINIATFEDFYGVKIVKGPVEDGKKMPSFKPSKEEKAPSFRTSEEKSTLTEPFKVKSASGETFEVVVKIVNDEGFAYLYDGKLTPLEPASKEVTLK